MKMHADRRPYRFLLLLPAWIILAAGCGDASERASVESARDSIAKGNYTLAVTQLKSIVEASPENMSARLVLAEALLKAGDPNIAEVEARKVVAVPNASAESLELLGRILISNRKYSKTLQELAATDGTPRQKSASMSALVAKAHLGLGDFSKAGQIIDAALQESPRNEELLLLSGDLAAQKGNLFDALNKVAEVTSINPRNFDAWLMRANLTLSAGKGIPEAIEYGKKALALDATSIMAHSTMAAMYLLAKDKANAKEQITWLRKFHPNRAQTKYFESVEALQERRLQDAANAIAVVLRGAPDGVAALQQAGLVQLELGNLSQAEKFLSRALALEDSLANARQGLAQVLLKQGKVDRALEVLRPLLDGKHADARSLTIAGEAYHLRGDEGRFRSSLESVLAIDPNNVVAQTALILSKAKETPPEQTVAELNAIAKEEQGSTAALAMYAYSSQRGIVDGALRAVDLLESRLGVNANTENLRGQALTLKNDMAGARSAFERAAKMDAGFYPPIASLATIDAAAKDIVGARKRIDDFIRRNPGNADAFLGQAQLLKFSSAPKQDIERALRSAVSAAPDSLTTRLQLVNFLLDAKDPKGALAAAQDAATNLPKHPDIQDALGRSQVMANEIHQAIATYGRMVADFPRSAYAYTRLAGAQLAANDRRAAELTLRRALTVDPAFLPALQALSEVLISNRQWDEALSLARQAQQRIPEKPAGALMEGAALIAKRDFSSAAAVYKAAVAKFDQTELAIKYHAAIGHTDSIAAGRFIDAWLSKHPKDARFLGYLADTALARDILDVAEANYRKIVELQPTNFEAMNNLAWTLAKAGKPGGVQFAEKAIKLKPDTAGLYDTLGLSYAAERDWKRALEAQRKACELAPRDLGLKLNLAKFLIQSGDKTAARKELDTVLNNVNGGNVRAEAERLYKMAS